jgi:hypothetical protein
MAKKEVWSGLQKKFGKENKNPGFPGFFGAFLQLSL